MSFIEKDIFLEFAAATQKRISAIEFHSEFVSYQLNTLIDVLNRENPELLLRYQQQAFEGRKSFREALPPHLQVEYDAYDLSG
jgi:hypothetical protein